MADRRRAYAGHTYDPCPGCGNVPDDNSGGRPKSQVCRECRDLLFEARERRKWFEAHEGEAVWFGHNRTVHWNPYYWVGSLYSSRKDEDAPDTRELQQAFVDLIVNCAEAEEGEREDVRYHSYHDPVALSSLNASSNREYRYHRFLMPQARRDAIDALHQLIARMLPAAYRAGVEEGRSVLFGLANGEVSEADFNGTDEQARRRR